MKGKYIRLKTRKKDEPKKLKVFNFGLAILKCFQAFLAYQIIISNLAQTIKLFFL